MKTHEVDGPTPRASYKTAEECIKLKLGDVVIQQATNHAWINRGTQPCRILFVLMDAKQP